MFAKLKSIQIPRFQRIQIVCPPYHWSIFRDVCLVPASTTYVRRKAYIFVKLKKPTYAGQNAISWIDRITTPRVLAVSTIFRHFSPSCTVSCRSLYLLRSSLLSIQLYPERRLPWGFHTKIALGGSCSSLIWVMT